MHYYEFNVKSWRSDTAHLTPEEEGIYLRLVNYYYDTEAPIPKETQRVLRRLRLESHMEAVQLVLEDFFVLTDQGWEHNKCEEVVEKYHRRAETARENGRRGGRPRRDAASEASEEETQEKPTGLFSDTQQEPDGKLTTNHKPLTTNQEPVVEPNGSTPPRPAVENSLLPVDNPGEPVEKPDRVPFQRIIELYNEVLPELPGVKLLNDKRKAGVRRLHRGIMRETLENWEAYFRRVRDSDFLMGRAKDWRSDFDFLLTDRAVTGVIEGKYHGSQANRPNPGIDPNERGISSAERTRRARAIQAQREAG